MRRLFQVRRWSRISWRLQLLLGLIGVAGGQQGDGKMAAGLWV